MQNTKWDGLDLGTGKTAGNLSRDDWLEKALDAVSRAGGARLRIQGLVDEVGVTKGSFYWHFKSREDFILSLIDYWHEAYTLTVSDFLNEYEGSARDKLYRLLNMVFVRKLTRHDIAIRAWAIEEPKIRSRVKRTDDFRLAYVRNLLTQIGFEEEAADFRARLFLGEASWEGWRYEDLTEAQREKKARDFYALMIGKWDLSGASIQPSELEFG